MQTSPFPQRGPDYQSPAKGSFHPKRFKIKWETRISGLEMLDKLIILAQFMSDIEAFMTWWPWESPAQNTAAPWLLARTE